MKNGLKILSPLIPDYKSERAQIFFKTLIQICNLDLWALDF